jgi:hypothetical protein
MFRNLVERGNSVRARDNPNPLSRSKNDYPDGINRAV